MEILVFSSYPERSFIHSSKTVGVGNYTKQTLLPLSRIMNNAKFKVFAEILDDEEEYIENKILVSRCWRRNDAVSIIRTIIKLSRTSADVILFPFEMFMFGGFLQLALILPFLPLLKKNNKKIVLILHQVIGADINTFEKNKFKLVLFNLIRPLFYNYLISFSSKVVVFAEELKHRLGNSPKTLVVPHGVADEHVIDKKTARQKLGLNPDKKYALYFGYIAEYKGIDRLIAIWDRQEDVDLIIAGGGNPNHMGNPKYREYVKNIMQLAKNKNIITTGFVPEEMIKYYFSAIDVVVFPYTVFMSSSGPLAQCYSFGKAILLSRHLRNYFDNRGVKKALDGAGISIDEICFDLDYPIKNKVLWAFHNQKKLELFSSLMKKVQSWDNVAMEYKLLLEGL